MAVVAFDLSLTMTPGHCNVPVPRGCQRRADAGGHHTAEDGVYDSVRVFANSREIADKPEGVSIVRKRLWITRNGGFEWREMLCSMDPVPIPAQGPIPCSVAAISPWAGWGGAAFLAPPPFLPVLNPLRHFAPPSPTAATTIFTNQQSTWVRKTDFFSNYPPFI